MDNRIQFKIEIQMIVLRERLPSLSYEKCKMRWRGI